MKTLKILIATAALAFAGTAFAGAPWTYVDLGYLTADSGDERTDGLGLRGSFGFAEVWHVGLDLESVEWFGGKSKGGVDETGYSIFIGAHPALSENVDLVIDLGYASSEFERSNTKDDVTALFLRGARASGMWSGRFGAWRIACAGMHTLRADTHTPAHPHPVLPSIHSSNHPPSCPTPP